VHHTASSAAVVLTLQYYLTDVLNAAAGLTQQQPITMQRTTDAMPSMVLRVSNVVSYVLFILINTLSNKGYFGPTNADVSKHGHGSSTTDIRLYVSAQRSLHLSIHLGALLAFGKNGSHVHERY
jgi:hypothetical protein